MIQMSTNPVKNWLVCARTQTANPRRQTAVPGGEGAREEGGGGDASVEWGGLPVLVEPVDVTARDGWGCHQRSPLTLTVGGTLGGYGMVCVCVCVCVCVRACVRAYVRACVRAIVCVVFVYV